MKDAPNSVSGRVVKTSTSLSSAAAFDQFEAQPQAFDCGRSSSLHDAHLLGPAVQRVETHQQFLAHNR
jgi:hypothetical protein